MTEDQGPISPSDTEEALRNASSASGDGPPEIDPTQLDFSEFHPLDHYIWEPRCRDHFGGPKRHIQLWWWYKFEYTPEKVWHRWVLCRLDRHQSSKGWGRKDPDSEWVSTVNCRWCWLKLPGGGERRPPSPFSPRRARSRNSTEGG